MPRYLTFAILLSAALFMVGLPVARAEVMQCGAPEAVGLETDPGFTYCNIHDRRAAYAEERKSLRKLIDERRQNYLAPQLEAKKAYEAAQDSSHGYASAPAE